MEQRLQPPAFSNWTDADEARLVEMKIELKDTVLGRHRTTMKRQLFASVTTISTKDREELQRELDSCNVASTPQCVEEDPPAQVNPSEADDDGGATKEHSRREEV